MVFIHNILTGFFCFLAEDETGKVSADATDAGVSGISPTFTEKPKIVPNEKGTLVTLKYSIKADPKPDELSDLAKESIG